MIRIWFAALLLPIPALSQGLGLKDYIGRMPTAPGTTIEQKVEILSHMGVRLNNEGYRELESLSNPVGRVHMPRIGGIEYDPMAPYRTAPSSHRVADALRRADAYAATRGAFGSHLKQPGLHSMSRSTMSQRPWSRFQAENTVHPGHFPRAFSDHSPEDNLHRRSPDMPYDPFAGHGIDNQWARPDPASDYSTRHGFNPWSSPILSPRPFEGHRIENDFSAPGFNTASPWNDRWGRDQ